MAEQAIGRLQVVTVFVVDVDRAIAFYRDALGFDLVAEWEGGNGERMAFTKAGNAETEIGLYGVEADDPRVGGSTGFVFTSPDIRRSVDILKRRGVSFTRDIVVHDYGEGDSPEDSGDLEAEFSDPDGTRFLLHS